MLLRRSIATKQIIIRTTLFVGILGMATACGNRKDNNTSAVTPQQAEALAVVQQPLTCDGECPANVGMIVSSSDKGVKKCLAYQIGNDQIISDSKCISADVAKRTEPISGAWFVLPMQKGKEEQRVAILEVASDVNPSADIVVLKLANPISSSASEYVNVDDMEGSNNVVFELVKSPSSYQIRPVKECKLDASPDAMWFWRWFRNWFYDSEEPLYPLEGTCMNKATSGSIVLTGNGELAGLVVMDSSRSGASVFNANCWPGKSLASQCRTKLTGENEKPAK